MTVTETEGSLFKTRKVRNSAHMNRTSMNARGTASNKHAKMIHGGEMNQKINTDRIRKKARERKKNIHKCACIDREPSYTSGGIMTQ